jgi:hypothetical protein
MTTAEHRWAVEEFARCELRDVRHVKRLIRMATGAASQPAGKVTEVFSDLASREGAFRFLESKEIEERDLRHAVRNATLDRCGRTGDRVVIVPVDATTISLTERTAQKGFGQVGVWSARGRGLHVMSALALTTAGVPIGLCEQRWWTRDAPPTKRHELRKFADRETVHWVHVLCDVQDAFAWHRSGVRPWFQLDRGADFWQVLMLAVRGGMLCTVRSVERRHVEAGPGKFRFIWQAVQSGPVVGYVDVEVPARGNQPARRARLTVRAQPISVRLRIARRKDEYVTLNAVHVREVLDDKSRVETPLDWRLLTTASIASFDDVRTVIANYALRWRIEDFHRGWKSGICNVETSQLRQRSTFIKWATILATVAARALRLTHAARKTPEVAATTEFSANEIDAVLILKKKGRYRPDEKPPTLGQLVRWIADLGGYTGKSSGGPPGQIVIGRGLARIRSLVEGLQNLPDL